jgi:hypothetical protein
MPEMKGGTRCASAVLAAVAVLIAAGCGPSASHDSKPGWSPSATSAKPSASRTSPEQGTTTGNRGNGGSAEFNLEPTYASGGEFDLSVDPDRQTFTIRFSGLEANVDAGKTAAPIATRTFSLVLPVKGGGDGLNISFGVSGYALTTEGTSGYVVFSVNGDARVERLRPGTDSDFVHRFKVDGLRASECRLTVFLLVERGSADPDGGGYLNVGAIDAEIRTRGA